MCSKGGLSKRTQHNYMTKGIINFKKGSVMSMQMQMENLHFKMENIIQVNDKIMINSDASVKTLCM